jgi:hypothetical protein
LRARSQLTRPTLSLRAARKRATLRPPGEPKRHKPPPGALKAGAPVRALAELEGLVAGVEEGAPGGAAVRVKAPKAAVEITADMIRKSKARAQARCRPAEETARAHARNRAPADRPPLARPVLCVCLRALAQRSTVLELDVQRERAAAEAAAKPKPKARRLVEDRPLTQEEMLAEAVYTESLNQASLARILAMEEESKKRAAVVKHKYEGPLLRFRSTRAADTLAFLHGAQLLPGVGRAPPRRPARSVCAATGLPARYRDPQTKLPYAHAAALKTIRAAAAAGALDALPFNAAAPRTQHAQHAAVAGEGAGAGGGYAGGGYAPLPQLPQLFGGGGGYAGIYGGGGGAAALSGGVTENMRSAPFSWKS